jgi:general secretion pathway protein D
MTPSAPAKQEDKPSTAVTSKPAPAPTKQDMEKKPKESNEDDEDEPILKGAAAVPAGQELVSMDFPEQTDIQDIVKAVSAWTGRNVVLDRNVTGKVQILSPKRVTKEEAYQAFLSALNVLGLTTVETGKIIKIMKVRDAVRDNLQTYMGASWAPRTDAIITQIIPLKYIDAKQLTQTLTRIVSSANSIIPYEPTNTLIMSDTGYKVKRVLDIIALLDVQSEQPKVVMVPIRYTDAKGTADKVNQILQAAGQASGKASMRNFKVLVDDRTNSVIIFGPPRTIEDVRELVKKFDVSVEDPSSQATIHVRPLDYAEAKKLATTLSALAGANKSSGSRRPPVMNAPGGSGEASVADLGDNVKITADESTNSLLITGSKTSYNALNSVIRKLDMRRAQVYIEADILDLNSDGGFAAGTSIFAGVANKSGTGTKSIIGWQAGPGGMGNLVASLAAASQTPKNGQVSNETIAGVANAFKDDLSIGILSGQAINIPGIGDVTPGALIRLMKTDTNSRSLSSPNILTSNNEEATLSSGEKLLFRTQVTTTTGTSQQIDKQDVDTTLTVKPNISNSNYVTLVFQIDANNVLSVDPVDKLPKIGKRKTKQTVIVKTGQTVVISGLMSEDQSESYAKVPLLGDIPVLGWLFRNSTISKRKKNLVIFLTPHIVHGAQDLANIYKAKMKERDDYFEQVFGKHYAKSDFYRSLPTMQDGEYRPTKDDQIEDRRQDKTNEELRKALDLDSNSKLNDNKDEINSNVDENALTVPFSFSGEGGAGGTVVEPPAPPPAPEPMQEDIPPPPAPPSE